MRGLNLSSFKKTKEDKHSATLIHKDGHTLMISKGSLPSIQRKQLEALPTHNYAEGGGVAPSDYQAPTDPTLGMPAVTPDTDYIRPDDQRSIGDRLMNIATGGGSAPPQYDRGNSVSISQPTPQVAPVPMQGPAPASLPNANGTQSSDLQTAQMAKIPGFQEEKAALAARAEAVGAQGREESNAIQQAQAQVAALPKQADIIAANKETSDKLFKAYQEKELDPDHYWQNHSKIAAGIGMLLSGLGGGSGPNSAYEAVTAGINRDIDSQRANKDQKLNLWKMNREALGSDLAANLATQNQLYTGLKYKLDQAVANARGPIEIQNANIARAKLDQEIGMNSFKLSLLNPTSDNPDPSTRVQFLVPPEHQAKAFATIDAAKNTVQNSKGIDEAFWQAAKDARPLSGGLDTSVRSVVPYVKTPGQQALIARLGPTFSDIEGTVRQSAMDSMEHNVVPQLGDSDAQVQTKWKSLQDYKTSKASAAALKGFGIDLSKFPATNINGLRHGGKPQAEAVQQVSKSGRPMIQRDGKWYYQ